MRNLNLITLFLFSLLFPVMAQQTFTGTLLSEKPAVLKGKITGYTPQNGSFSISVSVKNWFNTTETSFRTEVKPDGSFLLHIPVLQPAHVAVKLFSVKYTLPLFLEPGTETELTVSSNSIQMAGGITSNEEFLNAVSEHVTLNGDCALVSQELIRYFSSNTQQTEDEKDEYATKAKESTPDNYKAYCMEKRNNMISSINNMKLSEKTTAILTNQASLKAAYFIVIYNTFRKQADTEQVKLDESYYNILTGLFPENQSYLVYENGTDLAKVFNNIDRYSNGGLKFDTPNTRNAYINQLISAKDNLFTDIITYNTLFDTIERNLQPLSASDLTQKAAGIQAPFIANLLKQQNDAIANMLTNTDSQGSVVNKVPEISTEKLFRAIIDKYKGKVILVDFWATWCPPCRAGIKEIRPLKEDFTGKDVVFLYLTGETSPLEIWQRFIPGIRGEHFRLSKDEWSAVCKEFGVAGIPFYMLVDKDGTIINEKKHHYSNEELEERFIQMMKK